MACILTGEIDPGAVVTHRLRLADASHADELFRARAEGREKIVLTG